MDKLEPTYIANGMSNSAIMVENNCQFLKKLSIELSYDVAVLLLSICLKELKAGCQDFPGGPVAKTLCSPCRGPGFDPWSGN